MITSKKAADIVWSLRNEPDLWSVWLYHMRHPSGVELRVWGPTSVTVDAIPYDSSRTIFLNRIASVRVWLAAQPILREARREEKEGAEEGIIGRLRGRKVAER